MRPLCDLEVGQRAVVHQLRGGKEFAIRMASLGFTIGVEITMLENFGRGPIIVAVRNTRVALGRGEAFKVQVVEKHNADRTNYGSHHHRVSWTAKRGKIHRVQHSNRVKSTCRQLARQNG